MPLIWLTHIESIGSMAAQIDHFDLGVADHNVAPGMVDGLHSYQLRYSVGRQVWERKMIHLAVEEDSPGAPVP